MTRLDLNAQETTTPPSLLNKSSEAIYQYRPILVKVAYRILGNFDDAQDAVGEVYLTVLKGSIDFQGDSSVKTYLYRMVINRCIDVKRRVSRFASLIDWFRLESLVLPDNAFETKDAIKHVFAGIDPIFTVPLILAEVDGMSYVEISELLQVSLSTVRTRIYRCRAKLQKKLMHKGYIL